MFVVINTIRTITILIIAITTITMAVNYRKKSVIFVANKIFALIAI